MIACPSCGGNVKFDILTQQLSCDYCHSFFDPYEFDHKDSDGIEEKVFDTTVFTCPQCGGEIYSTDEQSAGFCSFCGASTILFSRLERTQRPGFVIPFKKTKQDCKDAYARTMKNAIFAPKELRDPSNIDSFRGIYMPYWAYYFTHHGRLDIPAEKSHRSGDYIITDHYKIQGDLNGYHKGLYYDASSSFADNLSAKLAPFDVKGMKRFTPGFLSGFYADTSDVKYEIYRENARNIAINDTLESVSKDPVCKGLSISSAALTSAERSISNDLEGVDSALFPVWFMSYRNKDRVAYATVNGQTGKVVADIPIDMKRYILFSLLLSLPIFLFLSLFLSLIPTKLVFLTGILSVVSAIIYTTELSKIVKEQGKFGDLGLLSKTDYEAAITHKEARKAVKPAKKAGKFVTTALIIMFYMVLVFGFGVVEFIGEMANSSGGLSTSFIAWIVLVGVMLVCFGLSIKHMLATPEKENITGLVLSILAVITSAGVNIFDPIHDYYFYGAALLNLVALVLNIREIITYFNVRSTRRLPQFDKQGGDDRA